MAYHQRGGTRAGAGRPAKAPTKLIRIEENLADKIKELTAKLEPNFILSKWDSVENFLLHNQPLKQQEQHNKLPENLSEALLNDSLIQLLEKIFIKFSPDDFIAYWEDIDLTEIESVLDATPEKPDTASIPDVQIAKDATSEKPDTVSTPDVELAKDATSEKPDTASTPEIKTIIDATPQKLDRCNGTKMYESTVKYTVVEFSDYKTNDGNLLTKEQADILQAVRSRLTQAQKKGLLIEALAGTGKSTMLAEIAKVLKDEKLSPLECIFVVFGRKNKQDLAEKLSEIKWEKSVQTLNSLGYEMLRDALLKNHKQFRLNHGKYEKIAQESGYLDRYNKWGEKIPGKLLLENHNGEVAIKSKGDFVDLLDKMRLHCYFLDEIDNNNVWEIASKYGLEIFKSRITEITEAVGDVL